MDHAFGVGGFQSFGDLHEERERLADGNRSARDAIGQRLALDQLHDEEAGAVVRFEAIESRYVAVIERRQDARLALEAGEPLGVVGQLVRA